jgi:hypothetical protein
VVHAALSEPAAAAGCGALVQHCKASVVAFQPPLCKLVAEGSAVFGFKAGMVDVLVNLSVDRGLRQMLLNAAQPSNSLEDRAHVVMLLKEKWQQVRIEVRAGVPSS